MAMPIQGQSPQVSPQPYQVPKADDCERQPSVVWDVLRSTVYRAVRNGTALPVGILERDYWVPAALDINKETNGRFVFSLQMSILK